jgi:predicted  nucleic acid-binding Zn-ribbon protein
MHVNLRIISLLLAMSILTFLCGVTSAAANPTVSARVTSVSSFDGRAQGENYTGAWVTVSQVTVDGRRLSRSSFAFELSGDYGRPFRMLAISSRRTTPSLPASVASRVNHLDLGNRYWIDTGTIPNLRRMVQSLDRQDQEVVYAICDLMSQQEFVSSLLPRMVQDRRGDSVYAEYWQNSSRVREITALASSCLRQMRRLVQFDAPPQVAASTQTSAAAAPVASAPSTTSSSPADQVRLAQTILAAMGLYTSSIDGVAGPGTNRALTAAMWQMNSTAAPTVENFLRVAVGRIRTIEQPAAAPSNTAELTELRVQNANLTSQLESARREVTAVASELAEARSSLATLLVETSAASGDANAAQDAVAALEAQLAELSAAHATEVAELTAAVEQARTEVRSNDAANATIADLREELEALRPLTAQLDTLTEQNTSLQRQLSAANETVADLRDGIASDERVTEIQRQLDAANATVANLRDEMTAAYVPVADYVALQRQVSALNVNNTEMRV